VCAKECVSSREEISSIRQRVVVQGRECESQRVVCDPAKECRSTREWLVVQRRDFKRQRAVCSPVNRFRGPGSDPWSREAIAGIEARFVTRGKDLEPGGEQFVSPRDGSWSTREGFSSARGWSVSREGLSSL
jgi:hypothetical protein